jgi:ectoine hydroxylase-related dioxygenase (phytanoyl-CoA dioxygenase family)
MMMQPIYQQQAEQYAREGYALFENVLQAPLLEMLREQCAVCLAREDARMDELRVDSIGLTHRGKRYFVAQCQRVQPVLRQLLFSPLIADVCRATLGFDAYFFLDQFVVKGADGGLPFSWHQDSGYVVGNGGPPDHLPYVSFWIPLDDTTAANGAVKLVPFSAHPPARGILPHRRDVETHDLFAEVDQSKVITVEAAAGSILALSSRLLHATGPNPGAGMRRVYLAQYTPEVMVNPGTRHLRNNAVPLLRSGQHLTFP